MKKIERIFLYSMLAILFFYVFLVDGKVESQEAIQEEIRARRIVIVNDAGQEVVYLWADEDGGVISILNKAGTTVAGIFTKEDDVSDGGHMCVFNKYGNPVVGVGAYKDEGTIQVYNIQGDMIGTLP